MKKLDDFYLQQVEPFKSCLLALREIILSKDKDITASWKYSMPFFCYKGKMICYLWIHKKLGQPYIGIVEGKRLTHSYLIVEKRSRMKIMLFDPKKDLPLQKLNSVLKEMLNLYKSGEIKTKG